jgi:starch phosphorylase
MTAATAFNPKLAYFSMEIALESGMRTYGGGLGVFAGDTIRAAADMRMPMVAVTLLHRRGYFARLVATTRASRRAVKKWRRRPGAVAFGHCYRAGGWDMGQ